MLVLLVQFRAPCRNTMVTDGFYGDTWEGIFRLCSVSFDLRGPRVSPVVSLQDHKPTFCPLQAAG